jgi:hypothetical protein
MKERKPSKANLKRQADKLFSTKVRSRGRCEWCKAVNDTLQCAHIYSRNNLHLRYDEQNALCLCSKCHFKWHQRPLEGAEWFSETYPERDKYLAHERNILEKSFDYEKRIEELKGGQDVNI